MSYFAFGLVIEEADGQATRASAISSLQSCAQRIGLSVTLGGEREPVILADMRGTFVAANEVPFFCLGAPPSDTSDELISPHAVGIEGAARGLAMIAEWVCCVIQEAGHSSVRLWLTEGWDDAFEEWTCSPGQLEELLLGRLKEENDIPSMKVTVSDLHQAGSS